MKNLSGAVICMVLLTGAAAANEPYLPRAERTFNRIDQNHDGKIALTEFAPLAGRRFARMDLNSDKAVTANELEKAMLLAAGKRRDRIMSFLDSDKNGSITQLELDKIVEAMFNSADSDHDGSVTLTEAQSFKRAPWRKSMMGQGAN
jgi:Ca2+-binding EF-hand superfamily protein